MRRLAALALSLAACSGRARWVDSYPPARPGASAAASASAPPALPPPPPVPVELLADGEALERFARAPRAGALAPARDVPKVLRRALDRTLTGEVDGGERLVVAADLAEDRTASVRVTVAAGGCLTAGAHGGVGVLETDLFVTRAGERSALLGQDTTRGPGAIVGGRAGCLRNGGATALEVEIWAVARAGGGLVLVEIVRVAAPR